MTDLKIHFLLGDAVKSKCKSKLNFILLPLLKELERINKQGTNTEIFFF